MITRGSQMAIDLVARSLIEPGDAVAVESPGYNLAIDVFRRPARASCPSGSTRRLDVPELARSASARASAWCI